MKVKRIEAFRQLPHDPFELVGQCVDIGPRGIGFCHRQVGQTPNEIHQRRVSHVSRFAEMSLQGKGRVPGSVGGQVLGGQHEPIEGVARLFRCEPKHPHFRMKHAAVWRFHFDHHGFQEREQQMVVRWRMNRAALHEHLNLGSGALQRFVQGYRILEELVVILGGVQNEL